MESPKPPQLVANMHDRGEEGGVGIDINRCRFNSFVETDHELPVFAPTDEMKARHGGKIPKQCDCGAFCGAWVAP